MKAYAKQLSVVAMTALVLAASATPVLAAPDHATGLERAREMSMKALDQVKGKSADAPGHNAEAKVTGRERALQAILKGLAKGNGNGNGNGRGHSAEVLQILIDGGSTPAELAGEHGEAVSKMVKAFNALRKAAR
jgi:hypothetical protein